METDTINEYLLKLVHETSRELLKIYFDKSNCGKDSLLKFPQYRNDGNIRISEQELRFTFINIHENLKQSRLAYSVETPTEEDYVFTGNSERKRSASSDMSFYDNEKKILNIEFKAHNAKQESINKDIEKLVRENCEGTWIHVFKNEDEGTVKALFRKFKIAFEKHNISKKPISFHILILETQTLLSRKSKEGETNYSGNIFNIDYTLWKNLNEGEYQFKNGKPTSKENHDEDWQIEKFNIKNEINN